MQGLALGKKLRLFDSYIEARKLVDDGLLTGQEAMSVSDFPTYMSKFFRHTFLGRFQEIQGAWRQYTRDFSVEDFEDWTSSSWGRFPDIPEKSFEGPYEELALVEVPGAQINLREFGATFALTRRLVISDRLGEIAKLPTLFAEALARTMSKEAAVNRFQANPTMWDGNALFSVAHGNIGSTALTANETGMNALIAAEQALDAQTDAEGYKIAQPGLRHTLIVPVEYRWIVNVLNGPEQVPNAGGTMNVANQVRGRYDVIEEPYFTDTNNWYMSLDLKGELGFLAHVTLNGNDQPFLGLKDPGVRGILGGDDPYSFEFDEIEYKIRHNFNFIPIEWRGIFGALVA
jgi:hypothetical protein